MILLVVLGVSVVVELGEAVIEELVTGRRLVVLCVGVCVVLLVVISVVLDEGAVVVLLIGIMSVELVVGPGDVFGGVRVSLKSSCNVKLLSL